MPVQIIEAIPRNSTAPDAPKKLRCAYYARISLDEDGTNTSIAGQKAYFEDYIKNNPDYIFSGAYYDDGISGTSTRKRHGFNQMLRDVEDNKLDVILVKSISRWGRNIVLTLSSLRLCAEHNCRVYFFKEGLWSDDPATNLILTIMSSMAEAESASIAGNVSLGIRFKFQQGKPMINCSYFLGYDKDPITKKLIINPSQAATVRFIYRAYLEGFSIPEIAKKLRAWGVPSGGGKSTWPVASIKYILSNEKYVGDLLMQKTWVPSFLTHKVVKNDGRLPQYFVADNHDAIVPREVFNLVQRELMRREEGGHPGQRKFELSGKVVCGRCGSEYKRFTRPAASTTAEATPAATPATTSAEGSAETRTGVESSSASLAVWKCKARASAKEAVKARSRIDAAVLSLQSREATAVSLQSREDMESAGESRSGVDTSTSSNNVWRCDNHIVSEAKLNAAVERALALLPGEIENIKAIQASCKAALATSTPDAALQQGQDSDTVGSAQLLLLHTDTALRYLEGGVSSSTGMRREPGTAGRPSTAGSSVGTAGRQGAACKTLDSFIAMTPMDGLGEVELLIDRVVVDGDEIKVRFKAGVEI